MRRFTGMTLTRPFEYSWATSGLTPGGAAGAASRAAAAAALKASGPARTLPSSRVTSPASKRRTRAFSARGCALSSR